MRRFAFYAGGLLILTLFFLNGCGAPNTPAVKPVSGKVTYNGRPVEGAGVAFTSPGGRPATAITNAEGKYSLQTYGQSDGAVIGEHVVTIGKHEPPGPEEKVDNLVKFGPRDKPRKSLLPPKYMDPNTTPLKVVVTVDGRNEFDFDLAE